MAAGIEIYNYVTNQKGSPALYSDVLANRPAAGFIGRLFISTDTFEIYRDNGTTWDPISGGGGGVNIYNSDGSLTGARTMTMANNNLTFDGGANPARLIMSASNNITRSFAFATAGATRWAFTVDDNETGTNSGGNWYLRAYTDGGAFLFDPISVERATGEKSMIAIETLDNASDTLTGVYNITGGTYLAGLTMIGGNPHGASHNNYTLANAGNLTFANSIYLGAQSNVLRLQANNSGTITLSAASPGIRTAAATLNQIQYNTTTGAAITYTHASVMQTLGFYRLFAAGSLTVTNAYGLIVNDLNEYGYAATGGGALVLTNRWGIYQDSTTDVNYFGGSTLIGTTTNAGYKLDVAGTLRNTTAANFATSSGNVGVGTTTALSKFHMSGGAATFSTTNFNDASTGGAVKVFSDDNNGGKIWAQKDGNTAWGYLALQPIAGNVGIGTTTPNEKLTIQSGVSLAAAMTFRANNATSTSELLLGQGTTNEAYFFNRANQPISIGTNNTERIRITAAGNVGINTSTPSKRTVISAPPATNAGDDGLVILDPATANQTYLARCGSAFTYLGVPANAGMLYTNTNTAIVADSGFNITFHTSIGRAAFISNAGNFIVGSTSDVGAKLYVNGVTYINTTSSAGDYYLQVGGGIYATNNSVNLSIATQNNRFIAGEYGIGVGTGTFDASQTNGINVRSGTAPTTNVADVFVMYAADITAGNAAPHFRTENGNTVKIYQETTGVGSATFASPGAGSTVKTDDTFDGYTLQQVVKALRNLGILA
jgi:ethanolamine utilization microcompartment shell protein EutS